MFIVIQNTQPREQRNISSTTMQNVIKYEETNHPIVHSDTRSTSDEVTGQYLNSVSSCGENLTRYSFAGLKHKESFTAGRI